VSRITFCISCPCRFTSHLSGPGWRPDHPRGLGAYRRCFFSVDGGALSDLRQHHPGGAVIDVFSTLMVGAPRSLSVPSRGPLSMFFRVDSGHSRIYVSTPRGPLSTFFSIDGGCSRISVSTPRGPAVDVFQS
jgi:hypothetical protein